MFARPSSFASGASSAAGSSRPPAPDPAKKIMRVRDIQFSQRSVKAQFDNGIPLSDVASQLIQGRLIPSAIPVIRVVTYQQKIFTLDNRRLRTFHLASVDQIEVQVCSLKDPDISREFFSKKNNRTLDGGGEIRSATRVYSTPMNYDNGQYVFTKEVLGWNIPQVANQRVVTRIPEPLPTTWASRGTYYNAFLPLILMEAGAILAAGLEDARSGKTPFAKLKFSNMKPATNPGNPFKATFIKLGRTFEPPKSGDVFLLQSSRSDLELLGMAGYSSDPDSNRLELKIILDQFSRETAGRDFSDGVEWKAWPLGSLVTQSRMYEACKSMPDVPFIKSVIDGQPQSQTTSYDYDEDFGYAYRAVSHIPEYKPTAEDAAVLNKLNPAQQKAVKDFMTLKTGLHIVQGPPGTGKTTLIVAQLDVLTKHKKEGMVCAPSNPAVQLLLQRFMQACPDVPVILAGTEEGLPPDNEALNRVFLHTWGDRRLDMVNEIEDLLWDLVPGDSIDDLVKNYAAIINELNVRTKSLSEIFKRYKIKLPQGFDDVYIGSGKRLIELIAKVGAASSKQNIAPIKAEILECLNRMRNCVIRFRANLINLIMLDDPKEGLEAQLLKGAQVVFCTLAVSGRQSIQEVIKDRVLIIDEGSQTVEAETIISFRTLPKKVLLVGDHQQLPATVISEQAKTLGYSRSMLVRLQRDNNYPHGFLGEQHRMRSEICQWPSQKFYGGRLTTHASVERRVFPELRNEPLLLPPYSFIHIEGVEESSGYSFVNRHEINLFDDLLAYMQTHYLSNIGQHVRVITFYKEQALALERQLSAKYPGITIGTVDGSQGEEAQIVLVSCVRSNTKGTVGFVDDENRVNVALTRAKRMLVVAGNANTLQRKPLLAAMVTDARNRSLYFTESSVRSVITPRPPVAPAVPHFMEFDLNADFNEDLRALIPKRDPTPQTGAHSARRPQANRGGAASANRQGGRQPGNQTASQPNRQMNRQASNHSGRQPGGQPSRGAAASSTRPFYGNRTECHFFKGPRGCHNGNECPFIHDRSSSTKPA